MPDLVTAAEVAEAWPAFASLPAGQQASLIRDCSAIIEAELNMGFGLATYTEFVDGRNYPRIWLSNLPVVSITTLKIGGATVSNPGGDEWTLDPATGELLRGDGSYDPRHAPWWPAGRRNIEVTYQAGYADIPADVKRACVLTIRYHAGLLGTSGAFKSESIGDYSYTVADAGQWDNIPADAKAILANYAARSAVIV